MEKKAEVKWKIKNRGRETKWGNQKNKETPTETDRQTDRFKSSIDLSTDSRVLIF